MSRSLPGAQGAWSEVRAFCEEELSVQECSEAGAKRQALLFIALRSHNISQFNISKVGIYLMIYDKL